MLIAEVIDSCCEQLRTASQYTGDTTCTQLKCMTEFVLKGTMMSLMDVCSLCCVQANKKLDKKEIEAEAQEAIKAQVVYKKDDFFDMMSCEALDKMVHQGESDRQQHHHHPGGRLTMAEQRRVDIETFGGVGGVRQWHHGGRGRGRGHHGGRGGGRGGYGGGPGRGGYGGGRGYHGGGGGAGGGNPGGRGNAGPPRGGGGGGRGRGGAQ